MKITRSFSRHEQRTRVSLLLLVIALILALGGCPSAPQYILTMSSTEGGSVTAPGEGDFPYSPGTVVNLVAIPDAGYRFVNWAGQSDTVADVDAAETTMAIDSHYEVTANFVAQYQLTILSTEGGEVVTPGEGIFTYDKGTVVRLEATPASGYRFVNWTGDVTTVADVEAVSTSITMNRHCFVVANFAELLKIWDWYGLHAIRYNMSGSYVLMNDLDSATAGYQELASSTANDGKGWEPIGNLDDECFGTFDGQRFEIRDVFIHRPDESNVGLFAVVDERGLVENLGMVKADVIGGTSSVGGLVGVNRGHVSNSYFRGSVTGISGVGGLLGVNSRAGIVTNCYCSASVSGDSSVGGLVGQNSGAVDNSYSTGSVTGTERVGGLVGVNWPGDVSNSYSQSSVTGDWAVGGLVGENHDLSTVSRSYSSGGVTGNSDVGGLVGKNAGAVLACFWDTESSGLEQSGGGFGKTAAEMQDITTFTRSGWDIRAVIAGATDGAFTWNIVDGQTYPFLSWQSVS